jgi:cell division protease FtsH
MSTEGKDQHHDIDFTGLDFEGIEREEDHEGNGDTYIEPLLRDFRIGILYECFVDCVRNGASSSSARQYFHADKACTLVIRCRNADEKTLFLTALDDILDGSFRQKYTGGRPEKSQTVDFDYYVNGGKKSGKDELLSVLFQNRRIFIFMCPDQTLPEEMQGFVDAEIELQCTAEALETAVKKYVDKSFVLYPRLGKALVQVPLAHLMSIFISGRSTKHSIELAYAWLRKNRLAQKDDKKPSQSSMPETGPSLDDLHGLGAAGDWGRDLALDLQDWKAGRISWSEVDRGILLSGAPGTGKTTFAAALARTCGVNLIHTSMAQWQAKGHLGDYLKAMRKSFEDALKQTPCILFLDEFDSAGDRASKASDNDDYIRRAVNGLLECLDGASGREGVVVVGATNFPDKIDAALRRPGRLDKTIEIPLPDADARAGILRFHLKSDLVGADLTPVVERSGGLAGAWLEGLVRDARRTARRARRDMVIADLMAALPARKLMPAKALEMSAIHEAGHAIVALEQGKTVQFAQVTKEIVGEESSFDGGLVSIQRPESEVYLRSKSQLEIIIQHLMGGLAAEEIMLGERNDGGSDDLKQATFWAARMWLSTGQDNSLTFYASPDLEPVLAALRIRPDVQAKVEKLLQQCMKEARLILERRRDDVQKLADALVARGRLTGDEINVLLTPKPTRLRLIKSKQTCDEDVDLGRPAYECA